MKVSLNWVRRYTDIDLPTADLVKLATERLGGVEGVTDLGKQYDGIVVAKIVECTKHSNADKLNICKVDDGGVVKDVARDENGFVQVVCGAVNAREGILVAWIPPGAVVPVSYGEKELFVLGSRELRGELSNGMLASPRELGMGEEHEGILEIDENDQTAKPGTPFKDFYDLDDTILEIENKMFTHRPDCFGHLGVAREIAGIQHRTFTSPDWYVNSTLPKESGDSNISVSIEDPKLAPRYMAIELDNIMIKPSPLWLQSYLQRAGVRPINNVVDVTNYIMLETAQPLHAFDFDKVAKNGKVAITVRTPKQDEELTLLDGKVIKPHKDAALICSAEGPIALGGVMGGGNSEIGVSTTKIILEAATFNMYNIRRTSMIHGIFTDAVTRFNKGQPAEQLPAVLSRAVEMLKDLADAKVVGSVIDQYPSKPVDSKPYIEVTAKFINDRLGSKLSGEQIITLLTNVEFEAHEASGPISVTAPFWRTDIEIAEDIVEEVGRLYGFNQLPVTLPNRTIAPVATDPMRELKSELRGAMSRAGANEVLTYSFVHGDLLKKAGQNPEQAYALRNALSPDLQYYRLSLLPSLLDKVRVNTKSGYEEFTLFEIGKIHNKALVDEHTGLPDEPNYLEAVYTSTKPKAGAAYFEMLRTMSAVLASIGIQYKLVPFEDSPVLQMQKPFDEKRSAYIYNSTEAGGAIGFIGELKPSVVKAFKLPPYTAAMSFALDGPSFDAVNTKASGSYKPLSRYQSSIQDVTLRVSESLQFAELKHLIEEDLSGSEYDAVLEPLGVYQKEDEVTKNISFRITLSHFERTLTTGEVNKLIEAITWRAHEVLGAEQV